MWLEIEPFLDAGNIALAESKFNHIIETENIPESDLRRSKYELAILLAKAKYTAVRNKGAFLVGQFLKENPYIDLFSIQNSFLESLWRLNELNKGIEFALQLEKYYSKHNDDSAEFFDQLSYLFYNMSRLYIYLGEFTKSKEYGFKSLELRIHYSSKINLAETYNVLGIIYGYSGDSDRAIEYYKNSLDLRREVGNKKLIAYSLNNIGENYRLKGDLNKALECYQECYSICRQIDDKIGMRLGLIGLGTIHFGNANYEECLSTYEECLSLTNDNSSPFHTIEMLFLTIRLKLLLKEDYNKEYEQIKKIGNEFKDNTIKFYVKMTQAFILKENPRIRIKLQAQVLFEELLHQDFLNMEYTILVMQSLVELYLIELQISNDHQLLENINSLLFKMHEQAKNQHYYPLMIKTIILQARFALLNNNIDDCLQILEQAENIIKNYNLTNFSYLIEHEKKFISDQFSKWTELIESKASMYQKIQESDLLNYLRDIEKLIQENR